METSASFEARSAPSSYPTVDEPLEDHNSSPSFRKFCRGVREHAGEPAVASKRVRARKVRVVGGRPN